MIPPCAHDIALAKRPVQGTMKDCLSRRADSSAVERLVYTELVGGSNPSSRIPLLLGNPSGSEEGSCDWKAGEQASRGQCQR